jgi:hypothetical protein
MGHKIQPLHRGFQWSISGGTCEHGSEGSDILKTVTVKMTIFLDVPPCTLLGRYQRQEEPAAFIFRLKD